jgi:hypothetical protein
MLKTCAGLLRTCWMALRYTPILNSASRDIRTIRQLII